MSQPRSVGSRAASHLGAAARREVYVEAQELILDLAPHVFLFHRSQFEALRTDVMGFEHFPNTSYLGLRTTWLDR